MKKHFWWGPNPKDWHSTFVCSLHLSLRSLAVSPLPWRSLRYQIQWVLFGPYFTAYSDCVRPSGPICPIWNDSVPRPPGPPSQTCPSQPAASPQPHASGHPVSSQAGLQTTVSSSTRLVTHWPRGLTTTCWGPQIPPHRTHMPRSHLAILTLGTKQPWFTQYF